MKITADIPGNLQELLSSLEDGKIVSAETITEVIERMTKLKLIEKKYHDKVKNRKDGRQCYVLISGKQISAANYDKLIEKLYDMEYGKQNSTLKDLFPEFLIWKKDTTPTSEQTLRNYTIDWNKFLNESNIVDIPIKQLKIKDFISYFRFITKDRSITHNRFGNTKSILNGIYDYAIENEIVEFNPIKEINCKQFPFKPTNNNQDEVFTMAEREQLLSCLETIKGIYPLAIRLDFHLVTRIGELLAIRWSDVKEDCIHIHSQHLSIIEMNEDLSFSSRTCKTVDYIKGNTNQGFRILPLTPNAKEILAEIKELNPDSEFVLMQNGKQLNTNTFNKNLKRYCAKAKVRYLSSHKIRFASATLLYQAGLPLNELSTLLGHTTVEMTLHYLRRVISQDTINQFMQKALDG